MNTSPSVVAWEGRRPSPRPPATRQERWLAAWLLVLSAAVLCVFVGVLKEDVRQGERLHDVQRDSVAAGIATETSARSADEGDNAPVEDVQADARDAAARQPSTTPTATDGTR